MPKVLILKGNRFINENVNYSKVNELTNPTNSDDYQQPVDGIVYRVCNNCLYRQSVTSGDCSLTDSEAKDAFDIKTHSLMPKEIAGQQVGHFCPFWTDFRLGD